MRILISTIAACILSASAIAQSLTELYKKVNPSVVVIYTDSKQNAGGGNRLNTVSAQGLGSGVLVDDEKWYIMTAAHVVQGADKIRVTFSTGEDIPAQIVSSIPKADVALLKLDWKPLETKVSAVPLGNSDDVRVGDDVFVIGAPLGLGHSLSRGIVSGHHHMDKVSSSGKKMDFLQTDASINQGNSGGPMFNMKGEVVGLASFILTQSGGFEGIGFAATSNIAKELLLEKSHFWSGLENVYLPKELARALNIPQEGGLLVQNVVPRSMGGKMGLKGGYFKANIEGAEMLLGGDVLLSLNDILMTSEVNMEKIGSALGEMAPGSSVTLKVLREGKIIELKGNLPVD